MLVHVLVKKLTVWQSVLKDEQHEHQVEYDPGRDINPINLFSLSTSGTSWMSPRRVHAAQYVRRA